MKRAYKKPVAKMVEYEFDQQIKATSYSCSGIVLTARDEAGQITFACQSLIHSVEPNPYLKSSHPCSFPTDISF